MNTKLFTALCAILLSLSSVSAQDGLPVRTYPIFTNYAKPPDTLAGLAAQADAVIVASVARSFPRQTHVPGATATSIYTDYVLSIEDVLKAHSQLPPLGSEVSIERAGGDVVEADHIRRSVEVDFPVFRPRQKYLLFLVLNRQTYRFQILYGPNGSYQIVNGKVKALGRSKAAASVDGKPSEGMISELRQTLNR